MGRGGYRAPASARGHVVELGYVSEEEKRAVYAGATALVNPSEMESLSIVLMEAWLEGTPAIVASGSEVMSDHVARSGGGMTFGSLRRVPRRGGPAAGRPRRARAHGRAGARVRPRGVRLAGGVGAPGGGGRAARGLMRVHQLIAAAAPGDAVTGQALAWQGILRGWGADGEIVAEHVHPELEGAVRRLGARGGDLDGADALVLHYSVWSRAVEAALASGAPLGVCYHNVTPGSLIRAYNPGLADACDRAARRAAAPARPRRGPRGRLRLQRPRAAARPGWARRGWCR